MKKKRHVHEREFVAMRNWANRSDLYYWCPVCGAQGKSLVYSDRQHEARIRWRLPKGGG